MDAVIYHNECGSRHVAYQAARLLPSAGRRAIMSSIDDDFGENEELPDSTAARIGACLDRNASEWADAMTGARLLCGVKKNVPLRISDLLYFKVRHGAVPRQAVEYNPEIRSFGCCDACHCDAARGRFDEDGAAVPGLGRRSH